MVQQIEGAVAFASDLSATGCEEYHAIPCCCTRDGIVQDYGDGYGALTAAQADFYDRYVSVKSLRHLHFSRSLDLAGFVDVVVVM